MKKYSTIVTLKRKQRKHLNTKVHAGRALGGLYRCVSNFSSSKQKCRFASPKVFLCAAIIYERLHTTREVNEPSSKGRNKNAAKPTPHSHTHTYTHAHAHKKKSCRSSRLLIHFYRVPSLLIWPSVKMKCFLFSYVFDMRGRRVLDEERPL